MASCSLRLCGRRRRRRRVSPRRARGRFILRVAACKCQKLVFDISHNDASSPSVGGLVNGRARQRKQAARGLPSARASSDWYVVSTVSRTGRLETQEKMTARERWDERAQARPSSTEADNQRENKSRQTILVEVRACMRKPTPRRGWSSKPANTLSGRPVRTWISGLVAPSTTFVSSHKPLHYCRHGGRDKVGHLPYTMPPTRSLARAAARRLFARPAGAPARRALATAPPSRPDDGVARRKPLTDEQRQFLSSAVSQGPFPAPAAR